MARSRSIQQLNTPTEWLAVVLVILALGLAGFIIFQTLKDETAPPEPPPPAPAVQPAPQEAEPAVIDYNKINGAEKEDAELAQLMDERKARYGVDQSLDMIVTDDESIKVGEHTVSMKDILGDVAVSRGEIVEDELGQPASPALQADVADEIPAAVPEGAPAAGPPKRRTAPYEESTIEGAGVAAGETASPEAGAPAPKRAARREFGVYVVQPGDNIWNIHFNLLKEFFDHHGVRLSPLADEPAQGGYSSGVGKILKFSENMVAIYNLRTRQVDQDLNLIHPLSKVVIYNMTHVFDLLETIDYSQVDLIEFDGDTLWLPSQQG